MKLKLTFDSRAQDFRSDSKKMLHTGLGINRKDIFVTPDLVKGILHRIHKRGYLPKFESVNIRKRCNDLLKMLVNYRRVFA